MAPDAAGPVAHAPGQLGHALLQLVTIVIGGGLLDLRADLRDPAFDLPGRAGSVAARAGKGQCALPVAVSAWCVRERRFINGSTAIAITVQTRAATPNRLNRLV